jgi:competence protein ComEC
LYYFHQFPNYFLITNLGLMLISFTMMAIGLGVITLGSIPLLGKSVALLFVVVISALIYFVEWVSTLPYAITRGLRISLWELALLYLVLALLLYAIWRVKKIALYTSLLLLLGFIAFQSYQSINDRQSKELLILNTNDPSFFIRRGHEAHLIVVSNKEDIAEKTQFLMRSLDVYYGINTKAHYIPRKKGTLSTSIDGLSLELRSGAIHVKHNNQTHAYLYGDYFKPEELPPTKTILFGTWVIPSNIEIPDRTSKRWWLKEKGAFRIKLK